MHYYDDEDYVEEIKDINDLKKHLSDLYVINDYMITPERFIIFQEQIYDLVKGCFEKKELREYPVHFKFYPKDTITHTLELRHFVINLFLWYPLSELYGLKFMNDSYVFDCINDSTSKGINKFINKKVISVLIDNNLKKKIISLRVGELLHNLRRISLDFSMILGLSMDLESFIDVYQKNDRMKEIMTTIFDDDMQPTEIEKALSKLQDEEVEIFKGEENNPVGVILRSGSGIKIKQLSEFSINGGLKPDIVGNTIPIPINSNTLVGGLNKPSSLFIDSSGAVKSLVTNNTVMGKAGHFGKLVLQLAHTLHLSTTVTDCGTSHYVNYLIKDDVMLKKFNNRFYKLDNEDDLRLLKYDRDKHLIGTVVHMRSPQTCALEDGEVCQKCYGFNANLNFDIADGAPAYGSEEITKVVNQSVLSAKHLLTTISETIHFNDVFYKYFTILGGEITGKISGEDALDDIDNYAIFIPPSDVQKLEEMDEDSLFNTVIPSGKFYIRNLKTKEDILITTEDKELFLTDACIDLLRADKTGSIIKFKDLEEDEVLFIVEIVNNELTKPLYDIMALLNKKTSGDITIDQVSQNFIELLIKSNIAASAIQGELILNRLIKDPENLYNRPDFKGNIYPDYTIVTVSHALENNKSPLIGLSYQYVKKQILSDSLYYDRTDPSYIDAFFKKKVSAKKMKEFYKNTPKKK